MSDLALPEGKFGAILADPPWRFACWSDKPLWECRKAPYTTLTVEQIAALPIGELAEEDCCLFLWATWPMLLDALDIIKAWGFTYKTEAFSWVKVLRQNPRVPRIGLGYWTRANTEPCLLATRGHPKRLNKDVGQVIAESIREHSRKPDCVHERIERLVGGPYLELFARQSWPNWTTWGNEDGKFDELKLELEMVVNANQP